MEEREEVDMAKRVLKKDLEARIVKLEAERAIAVEYLVKQVRTSDNWKNADDVLRRMGLIGIVTDVNCPPNVTYIMPKEWQGHRRPEYYY
jgi:hypothetical protein